jgi:hypothetical protein
MDLIPRRGGRPTRAADRTPTGPAAARFVTPWTVADICAWLGCTDRYLRQLRADPDGGFPPPLDLPGVLRWWPPDILSWAGVPLDEAVAVAAAIDGAATERATS